jgi:hypothetical protein
MSEPLLKSLSTASEEGNGVLYLMGNRSGTEICFRFLALKGRWKREKWGVGKKSNGR